MFNSLKKEIIYEILDKLLKDLNEKLISQRINISLTDNAKKYIVENGYDYNYGARPLKRYLVKNVETLLAKNIIEGNIITGDNLVIDQIDNNLEIRKI